MTGPEFETIVRRELRLRDSRRRARLGDPIALNAAEQMCVDAIMTAAGFGKPAESEKVLAKAQRRARISEDAAFGGDDTA